MSNPDPRCCLGLSPEECANVPTNQCSGMDDGEGGFSEEEEAELNCSMGPDGQCGQAGSEYCDLECPYRD